MCGHWGHIPINRIGIDSVAPNFKNTVWGRGDAYIRS